MVAPDGTLYSYEGAVLSTSGILVLLSWLTATAVGFNRLSWVPLILAIASFIGNLGAFLSDPGPKEPHLLYFIRFLAYFGWYLEEWAAPFYSYFLLEAITRREVDENVRRWLRRDFFMAGFWFLMIAGACVRITHIGLYIAQFYVDASNAAKHIVVATTTPLWVAIGSVDTAEMSCLALAEILTAYGLFVVFYFAARNSEMYCGGEKVGLFKRMMLSTEIRVASLVIIGVIRAVLNLPGVKLIQPAAENLAKFMGNAQHLYTVVLLLDLLMAKMAAPRFVRRDKPSSTETEIVVTLDGQTPKHIHSDGNATNTLDTSVLTRSLNGPDSNERIDEKQHALVMQRSESA